MRGEANQLEILLSNEELDDPNILPPPPSASTSEASSKSGIDSVRRGDEVGSQFATGRQNWKSILTYNRILLLLVDRRSNLPFTTLFHDVATPRLPSHAHLQAEEQHERSVQKNEENLVMVDNNTWRE